MNDSASRNTPAGDSVSNWSREKYASFALFTLLLSLLVSLGAIEGFLRYQDHKIAQSDQMEPGLVRFDPELGWRLTPHWSGSHQHYDFNVDYHIDYTGLRADPQESDARPRVAVLGDSFTFGLGVADTETFVSLLNADEETPASYVNLGVPGYSTDQEYLLLKQIGKSIAPDVVLVVVYLGNDLFDNQLSFPMQADHAKPFFRLDQNNGLMLENSPVAPDSKPASARATSLSSIVLGDEKPASPLLTQTLGWLHIARRLGLFQQQGTVPEAVFEERFDSAIRLFLALVSALHDASYEIGADLTIVLLPGSSFINHPDSLSAQYQEYLRKRLVVKLEVDNGISVIDLATRMQAAPKDDIKQWYFPNESHLTPQGHRHVAQVLANRIKNGIR